MDWTFYRLFWLVVSRNSPNNQSWTTIKMKSLFSLSIIFSQIHKDSAAIKFSKIKKINKIYFKKSFLQHGTCFWYFLLHTFLHLFLFFIQFFLLLINFFISSLFCLFFSEIANCGHNRACWWRSWHFDLNIKNLYP